MNHAEVLSKCSVSVDWPLVFLHVFGFKITERKEALDTAFTEEPSTQSVVKAQLKVKKLSSIFLTAALCFFYPTWMSEFIFILEYTIMPWEKLWSWLTGQVSVPISDAFFNFKTYWTERETHRILRSSSFPRLLHTFSACSSFFYCLAVSPNISTLCSLLHNFQFLTAPAIRTRSD